MKVGRGGGERPFMRFKLQHGNDTVVVEQGTPLGYEPASSGGPVSKITADFLHEHFLKFIQQLALK
jgi:hypothetical protein